MKVTDVSAQMVPEGPAAIEILTGSIGLTVIVTVPAMVVEQPPFVRMPFTEYVPAAVLLPNEIALPVPAIGDPVGVVPPIYNW